MPTFNPTPAEIALTSQIFALADPQKVGIVTGDTAVKILSGANLSNAVLSEVWGIADKDNNGFLTRKGVSIALRLIGYAQKGEPLNEALLDKPGPLAYIEGVSRNVAASSPTPSSPGLHSSPPSAPALPQLTQEDKVKFFRIFVGNGPVNGLLSGEKARDVFVKSKLPYEKLSQIWTLADTKTRGALDSTDFTIAMYFIQAAMSTPSFVLPTVLPGWVYDQAAQTFDTNATVTSYNTGGSSSTLGSPLQSAFQIPRQFTGSGTATLMAGTINPQSTGQSFQMSTRPTVSGFSRPSVSPPTAAPFSSPKSSGTTWGVSAEAKASSDKFFDGLDPQRKGYIEGNVAVPFMLESKLPESDLAHIWDLTDFQNDGHLTREGFAVAMHLINLRLAGNEIPSTLPPSLVPPSLRPSQLSTITTNSEPPPDLLLDDTPPASVVQPQKSGGSVLNSISTTVHPFGPDFGQNSFISSASAMSPGSSSQTRQSSTIRAGANKDLLGDDDEDTSKGNSLPDNSAEIGNLRNQLTSTTRSLETTQAERATAEQTVAQQALQLAELQTQLQTARVSYQTESQLLGTLRERLATQRADIQKTREELITAESELSAVKVEKAEVEGSVLRDKEEVRELQRKMKEVGVETEALKVDVEKAKKDVRQQKGLLAIAKKQLATAEAEKLKVSKELEATQQELRTTQTEKDGIDARVSELENVLSSSTSGDVTHVDQVVSPALSSLAAAIPLPETPQSISPQPSGYRPSTNPFERLALASKGSDSNVASQTFPALDSESPLGKLVDHSSVSPPAAEAGASPAQTSVAIVEASENIESGLSAATYPASGTSDQDGPFLTPPSTAHAEQDVSFPGAYPPSTSGDAFLSPVNEIDNGSESSDSDDEALATKHTTSKETGPSSSDGTLSAKTPTDRGTVPGPISENPTFDDAFNVTGHPVNGSIPSKASPTTSGTSSPRRSRSPGRGPRTLSSHSVVGIMDPFGTSNFVQTPLEPLAGGAVPPPTIETVLEPSAVAPNTSNISDFDEAFGKLPNSTKEASSAFKFDSAFDDNFDFSSATNGSANGNILADHEAPSSNGKVTTVSFPPVSAPFPPVSAPFPPVSAPFPPVSAPFPPVSAPFPLQSQWGPTASAVETPVMDTNTPSVVSPFTAQPAPPPVVNGGAAASFDDTFGLSLPGVSKDISEQSAEKGAGQPIDASGDTSQGPPGLTPPLNPLPEASITKLASTDTRSPSPPVRSVSPGAGSQRQPPRASAGVTPPPPRASSPKMRTTSKSSASEHKPEGPSRHKLSIRFPFGRKDKSKDKEEKRMHSQGHQPLPSHQPPVIEPPLPGTVTPGVEDDAEPVKQLTAMGFSRSQGVAALEAHGYDVQKALNSLLGAS